MINNILPKIEANLAHAADALMLDLDGFVSETNATNVFMVDDYVLITPHADHCLPGITRETVINLAAELGIPCEVRRVSLAEFHSADDESKLHVSEIVNNIYNIHYVQHAQISNDRCFASIP